MNAVAIHRASSPLAPHRHSRALQVILNDRLGKKIRVKCNEDDTVGDLKKLVAAQTGTPDPRMPSPPQA
jgi:hypothetical protein